MGHHSPEGPAPSFEDDGQREREHLARMRSQLEDAIRRPLIGATGTHPEGQLSPNDDGAIQFAIGVKDGKVVLDFGTPVAWLGMNPGDALALAESLIKRAREAARGTGSILTLNIG